MRLFKAGFVEYFQPVHEKVLVKGETAYTEELLLHYTYNNISDYKERLHRYTEMEAEFLMTKGEKPSIFKLYVKPIARFVSLYILKQGFRDGFQGFLFSALSGYYDHVKYAKLGRLIKNG